MGQTESIQKMAPHYLKWVNLNRKFSVSQ